MTSKLAGKVVVVTGGSAGIGLGIAKCFAAEGAQVFITGLRESELDKAVTTIGDNAVQGDVSNLGDLDRIFATDVAEPAFAGVRLEACMLHRPLRSFWGIVAQRFGYRLLPVEFLPPALDLLGR